MEDAQKKAKRAGMPIANVNVMMASAAVLAAQYFPQELDDWEGLPAIDCTWRAWKVDFRLAHLKRQHQLQASGVGGPLGSTHAVIPAPAANIDRLGTALDSLALAVAKEHHSSPAADGIKLGSLLVGHHTHRSQQETCGGASQGKANQPLAATPGTPRPVRSANTPFPGNYCWTHGHQSSQHHTSATCSNKPSGHKDDGTASNTMGGSNANKGWNTCT